MAEPGRTEQATPRRRGEARQRGQVAKSMEVNTVLVLLLGFLVIKWSSVPMYNLLSANMREFLSNAYRMSFSVESTPSIITYLLYQILKITAPIMGACFLGGLIAGFSQAGFLMTFVPLKPQFSKLNPITGLSRFFNPQMLIELLKSTIKFIVVAFVVYMTLRNKLPVLVDMWHMEARQAFFTIGGIVYLLSIRIILTMLVIAVLDYIYQRYSFEQNLKMTKEEVKEEMRQSEGDPMVKGRIRQKQREITRRRMMAAVPEAQVVVTNPTHYAVALKYTESMEAPKVIAKGSGFIALKIKEVAETNRIPIMQNPPIAQTLYKTVDIGQFVPPGLYHAVAEIIAYVYKVKGGVPKE